jgi:indolepyruvate ferredoxin oxidoreductase beta subunit
MKNEVINITFAGIGGQGVLKSSDILAEVAFESGMDVKKSEVHGMSQRGGSVSSDVRIGRHILSPMIPEGETDFLVVLDDTQIEVNRHKVKPSGCIFSSVDIAADALENKKCLNIALLGALSTKLEIPEAVWEKVIKQMLPEKVHEMNIKAFKLGRLYNK